MYRNDALVFESCMHKNIRVYLEFNCLQMCKPNKGILSEQSLNTQLVLPLCLVENHFYIQR